jgi:hypothetical protein
MLACMGLDVVSSTAREVYRMTHEEGRDLHWEVATQLQRFGLREGDRVAYIGLSFGAYWARLSKVRIVAEIPSDEKDSFCKTDISTRSQVMDTFERIGAKLVVAEKLPPDITTSGSGWQRLGSTDYFAYIPSKNRTRMFP